MNQSPENETEAIRSEIDTTRRRMDDTMDALGDRLKGRHLVDEVLGFFRSDRTEMNGKAAEIREKLSQSVSSAAQAVTETVKANPVPLLLIGAGIAWMIYSNRNKSANDRGRYGDEGYENGVSYDPDAAYDPLEYPTSTETEVGFGEEEPGFSIGGGAGGESRQSGAGSKLEQVKVGFQEKASHAKEQVKDKLNSVGDQVREKTQAAGQRAREVGARVQARTREVYVRTRDRIVTTADEHPLELGVACLAAGVAAGLALPTPERLNRLAGPSMDRLRQRTRDAGGEFVEKGKRVVNAATAAAKNEAQAQGLTLERLRGKVGAVAESAKQAAGETAQNEGFAPSAAGNEQSVGGQRDLGNSGSQTNPGANPGRGI
jgi:hypothetical protein